MCKKLHGRRSSKLMSKSKFYHYNFHWYKNDVHIQMKNIGLKKFWTKLFKCIIAIFLLKQLLNIFV